MWFGCRVVQQEIWHQPCNTVGRKGDNTKYIFNFVLFKFIVFAHVPGTKKINAHFQWAHTTDHWTTNVMFYVHFLCFTYSHLESFNYDPTSPLKKIKMKKEAFLDLAQLDSSDNGRQDHGVSVRIPHRGCSETKRQHHPL